MAAVIGVMHPIFLLSEVVVLAVFWRVRRASKAMVDPYSQIEILRRASQLQHRRRKKKGERRKRGG